jgi:hypothetical protein
MFGAPSEDTHQRPERHARTLSNLRAAEIATHDDQHLWLGARIHAVTTLVRVAADTRVIDGAGEALYYLACDFMLAGWHHVCATACGARPVESRWRRSESLVVLM